MCQRCSWDKMFMLVTKQIRNDDDSWAMMAIVLMVGLWFHGRRHIRARLTGCEIVISWPASERWSIFCLVQYCMSCCTVFVVGKRVFFILLSYGWLGEGDICEWMASEHTWCLKGNGLLCVVPSALTPAQASNATLGSCRLCRRW